MPPLYDYACPKCGATGEYVQSIAKHKHTPKCPACGAKTQQQVSAVRGFADFPAYQSPIDGREIRGRHARREDLLRNNCREYEGLSVESREARRKRSEHAQRLEREVDEKLHKTISELDAGSQLTRVGERSDQPYQQPSDVRTYPDG
jgi:putative FmdB family regulatory protein